MHTEKDCNLDTVNAALKDLGLNLNITTDRNNRKRLIIDFNKEILTPINTNKQICEQLGIAKATFYLKMKEYRQNS